MIRILLPVLALFLLAGCSRTRSPRAPGEARPNVIVILTDDQGWGDLSVHGNTNLRTPNIDALARGGATFEHFYVQPVCSPTRAEFLTGRYHARGGVVATGGGGERLDLDEATIADAFRAAGYATAGFGKWHNGSQYPYHPNGRGFDEFYGFAAGHWGSYFSPPLERNGRLVEGDGYLADDLTDQAMGFLERNRDRPFFLYLPYNAPHSPMQVPERFYRRFATDPLALRYAGVETEDLAHTRAALAMVENTDWNVGRLLRRLDDLDLDEQTIVVYFHDNGPNGWRWNAGMRGRKGSVDEGGVRSPLFVRWPERIRPGTRVTQIAGAIDLLPTLAGLAGIPLASSKPLDGRSLEPLLLGGAAAWPDRMLFAQWGGRVSVRTQRHRLDAEGRLYDIPADGGQRLDVSAQEPETARRLALAAERWKLESAAGTGPDTRPFPVGHPEFPVTYLPAGEGVPHGSIRRSSRFPNDSYFTDWSSLEDRITWDVEVATGGRYEAAVYYTARRQDLGSVIELGLGSARATATITRPHEPPLTGAEHDRLPRQESYVKEFVPMSLGEMTLSPGRGPLTLRAVRIPGERVADVRYVRLTLKSP